MRNKSIFFNKFIVLLLLVSLSGQNVVLARQPQSQEKQPYDEQVVNNVTAPNNNPWEARAIHASSSIWDSQPTITVTPTPATTETPQTESAVPPTLPIIPVYSPNDQNLIQSNDVAALSVTYYVNIDTGNDANACTSVALPCQHIQEAINKASHEDTILVTSGTYFFSTNPTPNVVIITKSINLSGGWDSTFTNQIGASVVDGANVNNGILAYASTITMDGFVIQNGSTLNGGGVYIVNGNFTIKNSTLQNNHASGNGGGIFLDNGVLTILNSTISGNTATLSAGGIYTSLNGSTIASIQYSTIAYNTAQDGGGVSRTNGTVNITNSIIANNTSTASSPDCSGTLSTVDYSIVENMAGCIFTTGGNNLNVDPQIDSNLTGDVPVHLLLAGSSAINAGDPNPITCPAKDEVRHSRPQGSNCDIGAVELGTRTIYISDGNNQLAFINTTFTQPFVVYVQDENFGAASGINVTFTAPNSGASGVFSTTGTNITTATTNASGLATASTFTANGTIGSYTITASAPGYDTADFQLNTNTNNRYVSPTGSDAEPTTCSSPFVPCLTINKAIQSSFAGNIIHVATGTYTGSGTEVVLINKSVTLSGGWNIDFTAQIGYSTIDGGGARKGVAIIDNIVVLDHFIIQNGYADYGGGGILASSYTILTVANSIITNNISKYGHGGGIYNLTGSNLTLNDTIVSNNQAGDRCCGGGAGGGGIYNAATITLNRSAVINNRLLGGFQGSGIDDSGETIILNNSTVSGNTGGDGDDKTGIHLWYTTAILNNSTIINNEGNGVIIAHSTLNMQNTILALNGTSGDCHNDTVFPGTVTSLGYNLIGNGTGCTIAATSGDKIGTSASPIDPRINLYPMEKGGFHLLLSGSPAINAANPATCPATDQRGVSRPQGAGCDIGAYEYGAVPGPAAFFGIYSGSNQSGFIGRLFTKPLEVYVIDSQGNPVNGVDVVFTVPSSGASGVLADVNIKAPEPVNSEYVRLYAKIYSKIAIYETTVQTVDGIATIPIRANSQAGSYSVQASIPVLAGSVSFSLTNLLINTAPNFLQNGDFEDSIQGNLWGTYSTSFHTPICTKFCGNGGGTTGPHSGSTWVWFGGIPAPYTEIASISQDNILIPAGPTHLRFYLWIGYADANSDSNDKVTVKFDGKPLLTINATQKSAYTNYKLVDIDLSQYTINSSVHSLYVIGETHGHLVNFNLDDISINNSSFGDVAPNYWAWSYVERLYSVGITGGCILNPLQFCPANSVTRDQMAVFLLKGIHGASYSPPAVGSSSSFGDVPIDYWAATWIKQLAAEGITSGCGGGNYCPDATVTRAQMAVFLLKAKYGASYSPPTATDTFTDVPTSYWAAPWIEQLAAEGITGGCGGGNYCPDATVTRAQMAVFLVKTFNLP